MTEPAPARAELRARRGEQQAARPTHGTDVALRVSLAGPGGRVDLVVPYDADVGELAEVYAERVGSTAADPPVLTLATGRVLAPQTRLDEVVDHGDVLVVASMPASEEESAATEADGLTQPGDPDGRSERASLAGPAARGILVLACVAALATAVVAALGAEIAGAARWVRPAGSVVLLLGAVAVAARAAGAGAAGDSARHDWACLAAPALGGTAGFVLAFTPGAGGVLLALAVAGLTVCVVAAVARTGAEEEAEQLLRAWLVVGVVLATGAAAWLLLGASLLGLAATAFATAVLLTRMLPGMAVDVDDDLLLDLDRLAVTAWSAREAPRGGRRRYEVRTTLVREVVARSRRTVLAGVLATAATAALTGPALLLGTGGSQTPWARWGGLAMVALGAGSIALVGRSFRFRVPRLVLGGTAAWLVLVCGAVLAAALGTTSRWYAFAAVVVVAPAVVLAAVQLGRGWRSVWWARTGEVTSTLTGVAVLALLPLASGLFDLVRTSFS